MADSDPIEWSLYDKDLITKLDILPYTSGHLYFEFQEPGSGEVQLPLDSSVVSKITSGRFIAASYRGALRGGFFVEGLNIVEADQNEGGGRLLSVTGKGPLAILDDAVVWRDSSNSSTRTFMNKSKAEIFYTLILEAQARGSIPQVELDFDATTSSDGVPWSDKDDLSFEVGKKLFDVLRELAKKGDIEFGVTLQNSTTPILLSAYANGIGSDKSSSVFFRIGTNCKEVGKEERGDQIKNAFLVKYKKGYVVASDSASIATRGRKEDFLNLDAAQSSDSALTFASAKLDDVKDPRISMSLKVDDGVAPNLFTDYTFGDTVSIDKFGDVVTYRVLGIQADFEGDQPSNVIVEANTIFRGNEMDVASKLDDLLTRWNTANDGNQIEVKEWISIGEPDGEVYALHYYSYDDYLIIGGNFANIGGKINSNYIVRYYPSTGQWATMGTAITERVIAITDVNGDIYCATDTRIYAWNGTDWDLQGTITNTITGRLTSLYSDGTDLYITGSNIGGIDGTSMLANVGKYHLGSWSAIGAVSQEACYQVIEYGSTLYGAFQIVGTSNKGLMKYTGGLWSAVFASLNQTVTAMAIKSGELIFACPSRLSPLTDAFLGSWDGVSSSWTVLGTITSVGGSLGFVYDIEVYLSDIYVTNVITIAGEQYNMIAKYSGGIWSVLGNGMGIVGSEIRALEFVDSDLYAGGLFETTDGGINNLAVWVTSFESLIEHLNNDSGFDLAAAIHGATATTTLANGDEIPLWQALSKALRKITWANILATLSGIFASLADLAAHIADTTSAHVASAIDIADAGGYFSSSDVEGALQELGAGGGGGGGTASIDHLYYFSNSLSDVLDGGSYARYMTTVKDSGGVQTGAVTGVSGETKVFAFITPANAPGVETLPKGTFRFYVTAKQTAGTRVTHIRVKLYKIDTGGTQTLIATSSDSAALGAAYVTYELTATGGPVAVDVTDRLLVKVYIYGEAAGTDATCSVQFANTDGERVELSLPSIVGSIITCKLTLSSSPTITTGTNTAISWNTEVYDTGAMHDNSTNPTRMTVKAAGKYLITAGCTWYPGGGNRRYMNIMKNGTASLVQAQNELPPGASTYTSHSVSVQLDLVVGDYIEVFVYQDSGGNLGLYSTTNPKYTHVEMTKTG